MGEAPDLSIFRSGASLFPHQSLPFRQARAVTEGRCRSRRMWAPGRHSAGPASCRHSILLRKADALPGPLPLGFRRLGHRTQGKRSSPQRQKAKRQPLQAGHEKTGWIVRRQAACERSCLQPEANVSIRPCFRHPNSTSIGSWYTLLCLFLYMDRHRLS